MEHILRCNALKCRKELGDKALVTTCSHIFCVDCAARLGLAGQRHDHRNSCPACGSHLTSPDDAVISNLNPSEDYKTSVLSGLSPNTIMECASRALSFWAYQATQEVVYQEHISKAVTEKYSSLNVHLDKVINEANLEITNLQNKLTRKSPSASFQIASDSLRRKNDELAQAYKEKNRKLLQIQELYDKLKRKAMLGQIQDAAEDAIDSTLHGRQSMGETQLEDGSQNPLNYQNTGSPYGHHHSALHENQRIPIGSQQHTVRQNYGTSWPRTMGDQSNVPITPSTHRQRLGDTNVIGLSTIPGVVSGTPRTQQTRNMPNSHGELPSSSFQSNTRYPALGLSSGLRVGHGGGDPDRFTASSTRPRVAQRPTPVSSTFSRRSTGGQPETILGGIRSGFTGSL
ncbi:hypothetical protein F5Y06DRAFT_307273 [Hypoxylon sp. FL0890]|nr:hypothetical protein F5Y06DRAFT_307273 [Hypoxylon sp. FL0890]